MLQILHASFWKFNKLSNSRISFNWLITDEIATHNATAYFFGPLCTVMWPKNHSFLTKLTW